MNDFRETSRKVYLFNSETKAWNKIPFENIKNGQWIQLKESNGDFIGTFKRGGELYEPEVQSWG